MRTLSKVFLARCIVLKTFIDVVSDDNQGKLPSSIRHDWLLFQLHPADIPIIKGPSTLHDPFTHIFWQLSGASQETLSTFSRPLFISSPSNYQSQTLLLRRR